MSEGNGEGDGEESDGDDGGEDGEEVVGEVLRELWRFVDYFLIRLSDMNGFYFGFVFSMNLRICCW